MWPREARRSGSDSRVTMIVARRLTSSWSPILFVSRSAMEPADSDPGRVDEDVHSAEALGVSRDGACALVGVAEVGSDRGCA